MFIGETLTLYNDYIPTNQLQIGHEKVEIETFPGENFTIALNGFIYYPSFHFKNLNWLRKMDFIFIHYYKEFNVGFGFEHKNIPKTYSNAFPF